MNIKIRKEAIGDYGNIAAVNYQAFHNWKADNTFVKEAIMVSVLRQSSNFDPDLSLVAEDEAGIIGHVLVTPYYFQHSSKMIKGAFLGPVAVVPKYQKTGVGKLLIEQAHKIAEEKNIEVIALCGHPSYYPKFGYVGSTFSLSGCNISTQSTKSNSSIKEEVFSIEHLDWVKKHWCNMHKKDRLSVYPGDGLIDWINYASPCRSAVLKDDGEIIAYIRYQLGDAVQVKELVTKEENFKGVVDYLMTTYTSSGDHHLELVLEFDLVETHLGGDANYTLEDTSSVYDAFMLKPLQAEGPVVNYLDQLKNGLIKPAVLSLPPHFDIEEN